MFAFVRELISALINVHLCSERSLSYLVYTPWYHLRLVEVSSLLQSPSQNNLYQVHGGSSYYADLHPLGQILLPEMEEHKIVCMVIVFVNLRTTLP